MSFNQLKGQNLAIELLQRGYSLKQIAPAYLFAGNEGIGRRLAALSFTTMLFSQNSDVEQQAIINKQVMDLNHPDLFWVEPTYLHQGKLITAKEAIANSISRKTAPQIRIEQIREIIEFLGRPPLLSSRSVVIIEGAHQMTEASANGLLKTLEEPGLATLILIANSNQPLLSTIVSRCQRVPFFRLNDTELTEVLQDQGYAEIVSDPDILALAQGSPGRALALAQQFKKIPPELLSRLKNVPQTLTTAFTLAQAIIQELDTEEQMWLIDYLQSYYWRSGQVPQIATIWEKARQYLQQYVNPRLVWECTLLEILNN